MTIIVANPERLPWVREQLMKYLIEDMVDEQSKIKKEDNQ